jgi:hypothetical protein
MTIGWIREDAIDRFFEATETTTSNSVCLGHSCPFCDTYSPSLKALYDHLSESHSARRPTLLVAGREPLSLDVVRRRISPDDIRTFDTAQLELSLDAAPFRLGEHSQLVQALTEPGARSVVVRLKNSATGGGGLSVKSYSLGVFLPSDQELENVDRAFVRLFGTNRPHISRIPEFMSCAGGGAAESYAEALSDYVRGVLIKDQDPSTGIHGNPAGWLDAYKRAVTVLNAVERPLAVLISAIIRFALNDFSQWQNSTEFLSLDHSVRILGSLAACRDPTLELPPVQPDQYRGVCPVDAGVTRVIELSSRYSKLDRWSLIDDEEVTRLANLPELGSLDRAKVRALWSWAALRLKAREQAQEPLLQISGHDCFGNWAQNQLEGKLV